jgi:CheY-like chemotaxis protein
MLLEIQGHTVHAVDGGPAAVSFFESGAAPDLVILDVNMPVMSGPETLAHILRIRPSQLVLMSSGHSDERMQELSVDRSNVHWIQKPFTLDELDAKLSAMRLRA